MKENGNEIKGNGSLQDYGLRISDTRLGKFFSEDPLFRDYPWNSTYAFAENSPIKFIDLDCGEKDCPNLPGNSGQKRPFAWPGLSLISFRKIPTFEQSVVFDGAQRFKTPEGQDGNAYENKINIGNSDNNVTINYDMDKNEDHMSVDGRFGEVNQTNGYVKGVGSLIVSGDHHKIKVTPNPFSAEAGSTSQYSVSHNDRRVFVRNKYYLKIFKFEFHIWTSKVRMLSAFGSKRALENKEKNKDPIPEGDNLKKEFEQQEGIKNQDDYLSDKYHK